MRRALLIPCLLFAFASIAKAQDGPALPAPTLVEALTHRDDAIRKAAAEALSEIGEQAVPTLLETVAEGGKRSAVAAAHVFSGIAVDMETEGQQWPKLDAIVNDRSASEWRWSIAVALLYRTKASLADSNLVTSVLEGLNSQTAMRQYAAVKFMYYRGRAGLGDRADEVAEALVSIVENHRPFTELDVSENIINNGLLARVKHIEVSADPARPLAEATFFESPDHLILAALERVGDTQDPTTRAQLQRGYRFIAKYRSPKAGLDAALRLADLDESEKALEIARRVIRNRFRRPVVREQALGVVEVLGAKGLPALEDVTPLLKDHRSSLRLAAARGIQSIAKDATAAEVAETRATLKRAIELAQLADAEEEAMELAEVLNALPAE